MKKLLFIILLLVGAASARTYGPYAFPGTQTPLSDNGNWINGGTTGLDFANVNTSGGRAIGTQLGSESCPSNCNDSTAVVGGFWNADQTCQITVSVTTAPTSGTIFQEAECRVRTTITAHSITGYELNCSISTNAANNYMQIVRWNGALGSFTQIASTGTHHCVNGDVVKMTIVGTTITGFLNGVSILSVTDSTYASGSPGIGLFTTGGTGLNNNFGISSVTLTDTNTALWAGFIDPIRGRDWTTAGVVGGIPSGSWTQCGATITATGSDQTTQINNALAHTGAGYTGCTSNQYVLLAAGTFTIAGHITVNSNEELRGSGADQTILNTTGSSNGAVINLGTGQPAISTATNISSGVTQGSTSIVVASATNMAIGKLMIINELNNSSFVTINGDNGDVCNFCDGGIGWNGTRVRGEIVEITGVAGTTITFSPPLSSVYTLTPQATPYSASVKNAGVKNLQVISNKTSGVGYDEVYNISACENCWVRGVEDNYADGDHIQDVWSLHTEIRDSYFSNAYLHTPGTHDSDVGLLYFTSASLVENNILERLHISLLVERGAANNVIAYNYSEGNFNDAGGGVLDHAVYASSDFHGAHPQFMLLEGNVDNSVYPDSVWGSSSTNTLFRGWAIGTTRMCLPSSGRSTVNCTGSNGIWAFQAARAVQVSTLQTSWNFLANVVGSAQQQVLTNTGVVGSGTPLTHTAQLNWNAFRSYDTVAYGFTFGYSNLSDDGSGSIDSTAPATTAYQSGNYNNLDGSLNYVLGAPRNYPASFYLSAKPSWWGSLPYPAIGPDITGGAGPGGHIGSVTAANPAQNCFTNVMGGTDGGAGSPYTFNADTCYAAGPPTVSTPTFSPVAGTYGSAQSVTISTSTGGATICYTVDGSTPTADAVGNCTHGATYSTAVSVSSNLTLKAIGSLNGDSDSAVGSAVYVISPTVATPTFSPVAGTYSSPQSVTISTSTGGATLCYTTDGSTPTANGSGTCTHGTTYSTPVSVSSNLTLKAVGSLSGDTDSAVGSATYVIPAVAPTFSPVAGTYAGSQSVTISSVTSGSTICYTVDATTPTANGAGTCTHGTTYVGTVLVGSNLTLKAIASKSGNTDSTVSSGVYAITYVVNATVVGGGMVTDNTAAISCPGTCSATYSSGTSVTLTATPNAGNSFVGWSGTGGCTGTSTCVVSMTTNRNATATFAVIPAIHNGTVGTGASVSGGAVIR